VTLAVPVAAGWSGTVASAAPGSGIHPGSSVTFGDVTCQAGAVMRQGHALYLAIPASCGGIDPGKVQDGCAEPETPIGVHVRIGGARHHGTLVYNSFTQMQLHGVRSPTLCYYNDLALVRLDRRDASRVSGRIPGMRAPSRIASSSPSGAALVVGSRPATAGAHHHGGWEQDISGAESFTTADVGAPTIRNNRLVGMLTVLPAGLIMKSAAEIYSFSRAVRQLHKVAGFHRVKLLRAGQSPIR
jgi:hypothetical protein